MRKFNFFSLMIAVFFASTLVCVSCSEDDDNPEDFEQGAGGGTQGGSSNDKDKDESDDNGTEGDNTHFSGKNKTYTVNGVSFVMVAVEGGTFEMGSNEGMRHLQPVHSVTLSSYYIGQTEVTQALWEAVMGENPSFYFKGGDLPVDYVSWDNCQEFVAKLNELTGENFRLPTEAEWEFAAKGGNKSKGYTYSGSDEIDNVAWYIENCNQRPHSVGTKEANELGIYDMSGNAWEWCQDWYGFYPDSEQTNPTGPASGSLKVQRGGCWLGDAKSCYTIDRAGNETTYIGSCQGCRLALSL
ncbi:MAG: formylglycine-generating enzyme family protein [Prevotellaceae bacterium]|nr:formylglycine-generating enzyme family protein [Prevotellaceae bacterium]